MKLDRSSHIFKGMPTLLANPFSVILEQLAKEKEFTSTSKQFSLRAQSIQIMHIDQSESQEEDNEIYSYYQKELCQNTCYSCYYQNNKQDKAIICGHMDRVKFARRSCCNCYLIAYKS